MQDLIDRRQRAADEHDQAKARSALASPAFAQAVRAVIAELEIVFREMLRRGAPAIEMARTVMWLGDAQFDLAQGGHANLAPAVDSYRRAEPYVDAADDRVLSAKHNANFANILIKGEVNHAVLVDVCRRYREALPALRSAVPAAVPHVELWFGKAQELLGQFEQLQEQSRIAMDEVRGILRGLHAHDLAPAQLVAVQAKLEQLLALGDARSVADLARQNQQVQALLRELMDLASRPRTSRTGRAAVVAKLSMELWQALADQVLNAHVDKGARDRATDTTRLIVEHQARLGRTDQDVIALERNSLRGLAREARKVLYRAHLTWASPLWPQSQQPPEPNGVYVTSSTLRADLTAVCDERGLQVLRLAPGVPPADAQFDAMRRASVVVAHLAGTAGEIAAVCYDIGIALVLGKPLVVLAGGDFSVPFDVDVSSIRTTGNRLDGDAFGNAIDAALYVPQRAPSSAPLASLVDAVRQRFSGQRHLADELARHAAEPLNAAGVLQAIVAESNRSAGAQRMLTYPAWPRTYETATPYLFHVMPFRARWSEAVSDAARQALGPTPVRYLRHDDVDSSHIISSLWQTLCSANHVLVDLTDLNPNVTLECGIAHALGKRVRLVGQPGTVASLFPALKAMQVSEYDADRLDDLLEIVVSAIA